MKKLILLTVVLTLCCTFIAVATADGVPSKTVADMVQVESVKVENPPAEGIAAPVIEIITIVPPPAPETVPAAYQEYVEICNQEVQKLSASETVTAYFGEVKNTSGETVVLEDTVGAAEAEDVKVHEFALVVVSNYDASYGDMTAVIRFTKPYEKDKPVAVLIGIRKMAEDGKDTVDWAYLAGVGVDAMAQTGFSEDDMRTVEGNVEITLSPELLLAIQENTAMMAVVDKDQAE